MSFILTDSVAQNYLELTFTPNKTAYSEKFILKDQVIGLKVQVTRRIDQEKLESIKKSSSLLSRINTYLGGGLELTSLGINFFDLDPSYHLMKLSQIQKIYSRLRFIDIQHGVYLSKYFEYNSIHFDPQSKADLNTIQTKSQRFYRNLLKYKASLDVFEINLIRIIFYCASWIFKIISYILIRRGMGTRPVRKGMSYFVWISQKIHMVALNSIALDLTPYAERTLFQVSEISLFIRIASALLISLLVFDFCEIYHLGGKSTITEYIERNTIQEVKGESVIDHPRRNQIHPLPVQNTSHDEVPKSQAEVRLTCTNNEGKGSEQRA